MRDDYGYSPIVRLHLWALYSVDVSMRGDEGLAKNRRLNLIRAALCVIMRDFGCFGLYDIDMLLRSEIHCMRFSIFTLNYL